MNATFNFYPQPQSYQALPSAPAYATVPVNLPVAIAVPEESHEQKYDARTKIIVVLGCWLFIGLLIYLFVYWANHVTGS
jgi:hypothetical protein